METLVGKVVDNNYRILEVVGRGGMGVVYKALDISLDKVMALKMIDPMLARDENFLRRFKTEARALAKLENTNIVTVHALRDTKLGVFMVMEYVEAKTLTEWIQETDGGANTAFLLGCGGCACGGWIGSRTYTDCQTWVPDMVAENPDFHLYMLQYAASSTGWMRQIGDLSNCSYTLK